MTTTPSPFSASDAALGYLYQVRIALLCSLRRLKNGTDFLVSLETLDDVTFETKNGTPAELLQTKHHRTREASLSDASPDLWKTLRVWFEGHASKTIPPGTALHLMTTAKASNGSAAAHLLLDKRDVDAALKSLESTARSSTSEANATAYKVFLAADPATRKLLIGDVVILDSAPSVVELDQDLLQEIFWAVERKHHGPFLERLEGWWFRRTLKQLTASGSNQRILAVEIELQMSDLREQFKVDALPIDEDLLNFDLDEATHAAHSGSMFVRQLELAAAGKRRIMAAVRDYYRAFEQRSRWVHHELLVVGDVARYEKRLVEEWELFFEGVADELGSDALDEAKRKAALEVLRWAESVSLPIRPSVTEPFVSRGSLHMLADELRIGWHPEFKVRLSAVLGVEPGEATQ